MSSDARQVTLVVAMSVPGRVIGKDGALPWRIPEDMRHFKRVTLGHAVIMGRKTHASIGRPLPERRNIVVSRQSDLRLPGCEVAGSVAAALDLAASSDAEPMVIGGAAIYGAALPMATRIHLTAVAREVDGDVFFPPLDATWREVARRPGEAPDVAFVTLERAP